jgi:nucleotide-binding universal stress UspA family protein
MFSERKIIVPLDGSAEAEKFLPYLKGLAAAWQSELRLLRVVDPLSFSALAVGEHDQWVQSATAEAKRYLQETANSLDGVRVECLCRLGPVHQVICHAVEPCDLIAFSPRGHSPLTRWIFGSVAEQVIRDAVCPVLLLRGETNVCFHHLLLPVDTSEASLEVCGRARDFVPAGVRVTLLHCHDEQYLDERWCKKFEGLTEGQEHWQLVCRPGKAAATISEWAMRSDCDLIAMATRGRGGWEHFWHGSVTERVSRAAPCPVLVFPPASLACHHALASADLKDGGSSTTA